MALRKWLQEDWLDISRSKKGGPYVKCGRKSSKDPYSVCRPKSVFMKMSDAEIKSSIRRKRKNPSSSIKHAITASGKRRTQKSKRK